MAIDETEQIFHEKNHEDNIKVIVEKFTSTNSNIANSAS